MEEKSMGNIIEQINDGFFQFKEFVEGIASAISEIEKALPQIINKIIVGINYALETIPETTRVTLILLAQNGWYISLDMPFSPLVEFAHDLLLDNNKERVDRMMSSYFKNRIDTIRDDIINHFPHRKKIITSVINAHKRGEYELSIPVILSQADGICYELIKTQLYGREKGTPKTAKFVKQLASDSFMTALLEPFCESLPITASEGERKDLGNILNRHEIVHGESYEYDTEINSLKAISFLNYVTRALLMAKNI